MIEKVNPYHPDKVADRIAGAIVDLAYTKQDNPKIAVEVLIGHEQCTIIAESSVVISKREVHDIVSRIADGRFDITFVLEPQDAHLAENQSIRMRCGDNGIFKGCPLTDEQKQLSQIAHSITSKNPYDGKYILADGQLTICQSCTITEELRDDYKNAIVNPLGDWKGGTNVDTGATNRKLGSDMADSVTGGGLHGKDLSKADVSVNIWCFLEAQRTGKVVEAHCSIGDTEVNGVPYSEIVETARKYINEKGGFEAFAEWGLF